MNIEIHNPTPGILEIVPGENITAGNAPLWKEAVENKLESQESPPKWLFNLNKIQFLDSSGISSLVTLHRKIKKLGKKVSLCYTSPTLEEVFILTKLNRLIPGFKTREEAIDFLNQE